MQTLILAFVYPIVMIPRMGKSQPDGAYEHARQKIVDAVAHRSFTLDLSGLGITTLPPEIASLVWLRALMVYGNQLTSLPSGIGSLTELRELIAFNNRLTTLTPAIGSLIALEVLDIDENQLIALPPEVGLLTSLHTLEIRGNQLTTLPSEFGALTNLETVSLDGNKFTTLPPQLRLLTKLRNLGFGGNKLTTLPPEIESLKAMERLELAGAGLATLPDEIGSLPTLRELILFNNRLTELPAAIGSLSTLEALDLDGNQLTALPPEIASLTSLRTLELRRNKFAVLPVEILSMTGLQQLDFGANQLTALPPAIGSLTALRTLRLEANQLTELPSGIGSLTELRELSLYGNQLAKLPPAIGSLTALEALDLDNNRLTTLPPEIGLLTSLQSLELRRNQLAMLPQEMMALSTALKRLYLHDNPKLGLSAEILGPNPADDPADNRPAEPNVILIAYFGARIGKAKQLNEVKLLLVGHGRVGKTCLSKAMRGEPYDPSEKETPGIERHRLELRKGKSTILAHVWDFGGQEFLHHTHQFFFSERSIYLIVLVGRQGGAETEAEYWLRLVRTYGAGSPVVIVLNQINSHPFDIDEHSLREKYPEIRAVLKTDCCPLTGIGPLQKQLALIASEIPGVRQKIDPRWSKVRTELEEMTANFVPFDRYKAICDAAGVKSPDQQDALATILNCLGIALNYRSDPRLRETSVLKPQWLVDGIYTILRWIKSKKTGGVVRLGDLPKALPSTKRYPQAMHRYLLNLMVKFELCFELDGLGERYLVPGLLSPNQPSELTRFMKPEARRVQFRYGELRPPGLIPQFIVRSHTLSEDQPRWQRGVVLKRGRAELFVRADSGGQVTDVYARGERDDRVWLTEYVYAEMQQLNGKIPVTTWVESEAEPGVWSQWEVLRDDANRKTEARTETRGSGAIVTINPERMLREVESREASTAKGGHEETDRPFSVFVCYAHANERLVKELLPSLKILANRGYIRAWRDTDLVPGEDWDATITNRLMESEIVLYMVSRPFLASEYIRTEERPISMKQHALGAAAILPILLFDCTYEKEDFARFEMLPFKGKALASYRPRDNGWNLDPKPVRRPPKFFCRK